MTRVEWADQFFQNMVTVLIEEGLFADVDEALSCLSFYADLHGDGPAIVKKAGTFEMLGTDVCIDLDRGIYVSVPEPGTEFYMEVVNSELMKPYND
jgi:hypothetical protein